MRPARPATAAIEAPAIVPLETVDGAAASAVVEGAADEATDGDAEEDCDENDDWNIELEVVGQPKKGVASLAANPSMGFAYAFWPGHLVSTCLALCV
jgi:hypothetical protein